MRILGYGVMLLGSLFAQPSGSLVSSDYSLPAAADTYFSSSSESVGETLAVTFGGPHTLMQFPLEAVDLNYSYEGGANTVESAALSLFINYQGGGGLTQEQLTGRKMLLRFHRVLMPWTEGALESDWLTPIAGVHYEQTPTVEHLLEYGDDGRIEVAGFGGLAESWANGSLPNYGLLVTATVPNDGSDYYSSVTFRSREYDTYTGQNPAMLITMTHPTSQHGPIPYTIQGAEVQEERVITTYYVSPTGSDSADGSIDTPFLTINHALTVAQSHYESYEGVRLLLHDGVYRESLDALSSYTTPLGSRAPLILEGLGDAAVITGAEEYSAWNSVGEDLYTTDWVYDWGEVTEIPAGGTAYEQAWLIDQPLLRRREIVTIDDRVITQVMSYEQLNATPESFWVDEDQDLLYLHTSTLPSSVEISERAHLISAESLHNITLRNLTFTHGGSHLLGTGAVRFTQGEHLCIDNCQFRLHGGNALSLRGTDITEGALTTTYGIHHVTVRDSTLSDNGIAGLETYALENAHLTGLVSSGNNWRGDWVGFRFGWVGNRLYRTHNALIEGVNFDHNLCRGLWFDYDNRDILVRESTFSHNRTNGLKFEVNLGPITIADCHINDNGEAGVTVTNTEGVTLTDCTLHRNRQSQIQIYDLDGHYLRDWETGATTTVYPQNWTVTGCSLETEGTALFWQVPDTTHTADYNLYAAASSLYPQTFEVAGIPLAWSQWSAEPSSQYLDLTSPAQESTTISLPATQDLTLREDLPDDTTLGDSTLLTQVIYGSRRVTLIKFDLQSLSDIPLSAASLSLTLADMHDSGSTLNLANEQHVIGIHPVTTDWDETSTWTSTTGLAGSLYDPTATDTVMIDGSTELGPVMIADLSSIVTQWQSGELPNYGIAIVSTTGATDPFNYLAYRSSEWAIETERPQLIVTLTDYEWEQSYTHWQRNHFSAREITAQSAPIEQDTNLDGISNLAHYAWNSSPHDGVHRVFAPQGTRRWSVTVPTDRLDLDYTLQSSPDLTTWTSVPFPTGNTSVTIEASGEQEDQYNITTEEPIYLRWVVDERSL